MDEPDVPEEEPNDETDPEVPSDAPDRKSRRRKRRSAKKERVLHTRVPEVMEQELKKLAKNLRMPVSNVVRAILEDAIDTMDVATRRAEDELRSVAVRFGSDDSPKKAPPRYPLEGAIGFAELTLTRDATCQLTGRPLEKGSTARLIHFDDGRPPLLVSADVLPPNS